MEPTQASCCMCGKELKDGWVCCPECGTITALYTSKQPTPGNLIELRTKAKPNDNIFLYITTEAGIMYYQYEVTDMGFVGEVKHSSYFEERTGGVK